MNDQNQYQMQDFNSTFGNVGGNMSFENVHIHYAQPTDHYRIGASAATLVKQADEVPGLARRYIGRANERSQLAECIAQGEVVLIQGFGGEGKTALAAQAAYEWMEGHSGVALHLHMGESARDKILEALAHPFGKAFEVAGAVGEAKANIVRGLLKDQGVKLVIFDDAWNGGALNAVIKTMPRGMPVIATARQRYPLDAIVSLSGLDPTDALALLKANAGREDLTGAEALLKLLRYQAFSIEVAGMQMKTKSLSVRDLLAKMTSPYQLTVPHDYAQEGRESLAMLIKTSLDALSGDAQRAFSALGAFWDGVVTPELLTLYFAQGGQPQEATPALEELHMQGLVTVIDADAENIRHYRAHDLAHEYAQAQATDAERGHALAACLAVIKAHNTPSIPNFNALMPLLDQFDGAQAWAAAHGRWAEVEEFGWDLYLAARTGIIQYRGLYLRGIVCLGRAVAAAQASGNSYNEASQLIMRAGCYEKTAQYDAALADYDKALGMYEALNNKQHVAITLGNMGGVYRRQGRYDDAIRTYERALAIDRELGRKSGMAANLGNLAIVYMMQSDYARAVDGYTEAIALYRELKDERNATLHLGNLGECYRAMGRTDDARAALNDALAINTRLGDTDGIGYNQQYLGALEEDLRNLPAALDHYQQALVIRRKIGNPVDIQWTERAIARVGGK
ncbi:MAG: tetratricopeptide repeat protein [Phototrophicaceae bacterium]